MIDETTPVFPNNVVQAIYDAIPVQIDPDIRVLRRPIRATDPNQTVAVFGSQWVPDEQSFEMGIGGPAGFHEPTLSSYLISIQAFVTDFDEERGLATSSILSNRVRAMLSRNDSLRVALRALSVTMEGSTETTRRYEVRTQRFVSNEIEGNFLYLSTLEFWLETERY